MEGLSDCAGIGRGASDAVAAFGAKIDPIDAHGTRDVLQALLAGIDEVGRHLALHLPPGVLGNRDAARFGNALDPRRDVDAVAKDILALDDDVADIDPDPELDRIGFGATGIVLPKLSLNFDRAGDSVHGAREFHQRAVAHKLDDTAGMGGNRRVDQLTPQGIQTGKSPGLVDTHEARVTDHVGRQDCCEPPLEALFGHLDRSPGKQLAGTLWFPGRRVYRGQMTASGHSATWQQVRATSALPPQSRHALTRLARQFRAKPEVG